MSIAAEREAIVRKYLKFMEAGDLKETVACFDPAGIIRSPIYGDVPVAAFYERLFADTISASVSIHTIYGAARVDNRWAAHFAYHWVRKDQPPFDSDLVDLFEFSEQSGLIKSLKIIFDR